MARQLDGQGDAIGQPGQRLALIECQANVGNRFGIQFRPKQGTASRLPVNLLSLQLDLERMVRQQQTDLVGHLRASVHPTARSRQHLA